MNQVDLGILLAERFPGYRPVKSAPTLFTLNGIGFKLYGKRAADPETGCYVSSLCFCFLFIPIFPVAAYVVCKADGGGWHFFGKAPLSTFARRWNYGLLCLLLIFAAEMTWQNHTLSPEYRAAEMVVEAERLLTEKKAAAAAQRYVEALRTDPALTESVRGKIADLLALAIKDPDPDVALPALRFALLSDPKLDQPTPLVPGLPAITLARVDQLTATLPEQALNLLEILGRSRFKTPDVATRSRAILESWAKSEPSNLTPALRLAQLCEQAEDWARCVALLEPLKNKLGGGHGARILGQIYVNQDRFEEAYPLLMAHVQPQIKALHQAEIRFQSAGKQANEQTTALLNTGHAPGFDYTAYDKAAKNDQTRMVDSFFVEQLKTNATYQNALNALRESNQIIPVVMDLGMTQLRRGQSLSDPEARKTELLAAEQTFLVLQSSAGETDAYRMFLGQVYYWLGRHAEGRELFEALLNSKKRSHEILLQLATCMREVGEEGPARDLVDEAYRNAKNDDERHDAASFRTLLCLTAEERLAWYRRCKPDVPNTEIGIHTALGEIAGRDGREAEAIIQYTKALDGYQLVTKSSASLNNAALVHLQLYWLSGQAVHQVKAGELLQDAVALEPNNSILMNNAGDALLQAAFAEVLEAGLTPLVNRVSGGNGLRMIYDTNAEYEQMVARVVANPNHRKGLVMLDKAAVLAPKSLGFASSAFNGHQFEKNYVAMEDILKRVAAIEYNRKDSDSMRDRTRKGEFDPAARQANASRTKKLDETLAKVTSGRDRGHLLSLILDNELDLCFLDQLPVSERHVARVREALKLAPCSFTRTSLTRVLSMRLTRQLSEKKTVYAGWEAQLRRELGTKDLLLLALEKPDLSQALHELPEFKEWTDLLIEQEQRFPDFVDVSICLLAKLERHPAASAFALRLGNDRGAQLNGEINRLLFPMEPHVILRRHRILLLEGKKEEALKIYNEARAQGVPLPDLSA